MFDQGQLIDNYDSDLQTLIKNDDIKLEIQLGVGKGSGSYLTSDISKQYIDINMK